MDGGEREGKERLTNTMYLGYLFVRSGQVRSGQLPTGVRVRAGYGWVGGFDLNLR